tara:strand:+ start:3146 stop:3559 length:414 start_codon:yes stop_codon:yes gene_type:complete
MLVKGNQSIRRFIEVREDNFMTLKHFKKSEFTCKCGCNSNNISGDLIHLLDKAREKAGIPFKINSGYRCENHPLTKENPTSSHALGLAVDIKCTDSKSRAIIMDALVAFDFERFGISKDFIHTDIDGEKSTPRIWVY